MAPDWEIIDYEPPAPASAGAAQDGLEGYALALFRKWTLVSGGNAPELLDSLRTSARPMTAMLHENGPDCSTRLLAVDLHNHALLFSSLLYGTEEMPVQNGTRILMLGVVGRFPVAFLSRVREVHARSFSAELPSALHQWNRRIHARSLMVTLNQVCLMTACGICRGVVRDISWGGVGIGVAPDWACTLSPGDRVGATISVPGEKALEVLLECRHVSTISGTEWQQCMLGFRFLLDPNQFGRLSNWARRQRLLPDA